MNQKRPSPLRKRFIALLLAAVLASASAASVWAVPDNIPDFTGLYDEANEELEPDEEYVPPSGSGKTVVVSSASSSTNSSVRVVNQPSTAQKPVVVSSANSSQGRVVSVGKKTSGASSASQTPSTVSSLAATIKSWQTKNSDVKAWLKVPGTNIDYPVLQSPKGDNLYYESRGIDKQYSKDGVIWASSTVNFGDSATLTQNNCIFGHNWTNSWRYAYANRAKDIMFAQLVPFKKLDFAQKNQKIYYSTEYEDMTFQIFAVFICNSDDLDYVASTFTDKEFSSLITEVRNLSFFDYDTTVSTDDKLITLSTCIDAYYKDGVRQTNQRFVVMGKLVKGDAAKKDVTVSVNTDAKSPTGMGVRKDLP